MTARLFLRQCICANTVKAHVSSKAMFVVVCKIKWCSTKIVEKWTQIPEYLIFRCRYWYKTYIIVFEIHCWMFCLTVSNVVVFQVIFLDLILWKKYMCLILVFYPVKPRTNSECQTLGSRRSANMRSKTVWI